MEKVTSPSDLPVREFRYRQRAFERWVSAHGRWWPECEDASVWGRFRAQAVCGRYTFSYVNQEKRHFAETFVASRLEREGYVCWTKARVFRTPERHMHGERDFHTRVVDALLKETVGLVPQERYARDYATGLRLKAIDVVGFHFGIRRWVFAEVKKDEDHLHPQQAEALRFLRELLPTKCDVFVASVQERD